MNLLSGRLNGDGMADVCGVPVPLPRDTVAAAGERGLRDVIVGLRPESLEIDQSSGIQAEVEVVEELGADAYAFCLARLGGTETKLIARTDWRQPPDRGTRVVLKPRAGEAHVFDPQTGERLGA
jgi:multiple sugar transport system ATP-binding protein